MSALPAAGPLAGEVRLTQRTTSAAGAPSTSGNVCQIITRWLPESAHRCAVRRSTPPRGAYMRRRGTRIRQGQPPGDAARAGARAWTRFRARHTRGSRRAYPDAVDGDERRRVSGTTSSTSREARNPLADDPMISSLACWVRALQPVANFVGPRRHGLPRHSSRWSWRRQVRADLLVDLQDVQGPIVADDAMRHHQRHNLWILHCRIQGSPMRVRPRASCTNRPVLPVELGDRCDGVAQQLLTALVAVADLVATVRRCVRRARRRMPVSIQTPGGAAVQGHLLVTVNVRIFTESSPTSRSVAGR